MVPEIISETKIRFNGVTYYRLGGVNGYFKNDGKYIHRKVWEYHHGEIPKGIQIHHIDEDKSNNDISNLMSMTISEHSSYHSKIRRKGKGFPKEALLVASVWHKSEEGRKWHSEHASKPKEKIVLKCVQCSFEFLGVKKKTCSPGCKKRYSLGQEGPPRRYKVKQQ